jgi:hypothetical protein
MRVPMDWPSLGAIRGVKLGTASGLSLGAASGLNLGTTSGLNCGAAFGLNLGEMFGFSPGTAYGLSCGDVCRPRCGEVCGLRVGAVSERALLDGGSLRMITGLRCTLTVGARDAEGARTVGTLGVEGVRTVGPCKEKLLRWLRDGVRLTCGADLVGLLVRGMLSEGCGIDMRGADALGAGVEGRLGAGAGAGVDLAAALFAAAELARDVCPRAGTVSARAIAITKAATGILERIFGL